MIWPFSAEWRVRRFIHRIPRTLIREVRDGAAIKLVGRPRYVTPPLHAPLSGRDCLYFHFSIDNADGTKSLVRDTEYRDFVLEDESGSAYVRMAHAKVLALPDRQYRPGPSLMTEPIFDLLQRYRMSLQVGDRSLESYSYEEAIIDDSADIAVGGIARWQPDPEGGAPAGYRDAPRRLVLEAVGGVPLFVTNEPKALR